MDLTIYPRPSLAVDTALLTVRDATLAVLIIDREHIPRLPGAFVREGERLADAVSRSLREKAGVTGADPRQLHVFDAPDRDDRGWVISVAHLEVSTEDRLDGCLGELISVDELPDLRWDHAEVVAHAVRTIRADYAEHLDPAGLLAEPFTMRSLHELHEAVAGVALPRDAFRRRMEPLLRDTGEMLRGTVGKPARLFDRNREDS